MEKDTLFINIHKLSKAFKKIYTGLNKGQLKELDKELLNIYPSDESEVTFFTDYEEGENSIGISIYISKSVKTNDSNKINFDKIMLEYLLRSEFSKLPQMFKCIELMERHTGDDYELDFIPSSYTKNTDKHNIHFRVTKK